MVLSLVCIFIMDYSWSFLCSFTAFSLLSHFIVVIFDKVEINDFLINDDILIAYPISFECSFFPWCICQSGSDCIMFHRLFGKWHCSSLHGGIEWLPISILDSCGSQSVAVGYKSSLPIWVGTTFFRDSNGLLCSCEICWMEWSQCCSWFFWKICKGNTKERTRLPKTPWLLLR